VFSFFGLVGFLIVVIFILAIIFEHFDSSSNIRRFYFKGRNKKMDDVEKSNEGIRRQWRNAPLDSDAYKREMAKTVGATSWTFKHSFMDSILFESIEKGYEILKAKTLKGNMSSWRIISPEGTEMSIYEFTDLCRDSETVPTESLVSQGV